MKKKIQKRKKTQKKQRKKENLRRFFFEFSFRKEVLVILAGFLFLEQG
jgi:hypothetical protein